MLRVERVGVHDNFFELGGDSILTIQIISRARQAGLNLSPAELFTHPTIAELSEIVGQTRKLLETGGEVPLTPIQQWFFDQNLPEQHHFNQAALLDVPGGMDPALIKKAIEELFTGHDALRLRFINNDGHGSRLSATAVKLLFQCTIYRRCLPEEQPAAIERLAAEIQTSLNYKKGASHGSP